MDWSDTKAAETLARNLAAFGRARGLENWNQMADGFKRWAAKETFAKPIPVNTLRNIGRKNHATQIDKLCALSRFLQVPLFMFFVDELFKENETPSNEFVVGLNSIVATFVNATPTEQEAIRAMLNAITSIARPVTQISPPRHR